MRGMQLLTACVKAGVEATNMSDHYNLVVTGRDQSRVDADMARGTVELLQRAESSEGVPHSLLSTYDFQVRSIEVCLKWLRFEGQRARLLRLDGAECWFDVPARGIFICVLSTEVARVSVYGTLPDLLRSQEWLKQGARARPIVRRVPRVGVATSNHGHLSTKMVEISRVRLTHLDAYYGAGMTKFHGAYLEYLQKQGRGVSMLHGPPGGGKTTYLRHIVGALKSRVVLFPHGLLSAIDTPSFTSYLMELASTPTVLVIEDAEAIITSREGGTLGVLLNLSDGLLGDMAKVAIILTYNCAHGDLDPALLRSGRFRAEHYFGPLSAEDATALATRSGAPRTFTKPTMLCDVLCAKPIGSLANELVPEVLDALPDEAE